MSRWFRHYAGMMRDEKLVRVAIKSKQPVERVLWIWGAILESAAEIDDNGRYDLDPAEVAYFLRADEDDVGAVFTALADAGRVADNSVVHWGNRQFTSDKSKERQAAYRERKRQQKSDGDHQPAPFMPWLRKIVSVGRVKWIEDSPFTGKDNCCWYLFDAREEAPAEFIGRVA